MKEFQNEPWFKEVVASKLMQAGDLLGMTTDVGKKHIREYRELFKTALKDDLSLAPVSILFESPSYGTQVADLIKEHAVRSFTGAKAGVAQEGAKELGGEVLAAILGKNYPYMKEGVYGYDFRRGGEQFGPASAAERPPVYTQEGPQARQVSFNPWIDTKEGPPFDLPKIGDDFQNQLALLEYLNPKSSLLKRRKPPHTMMEIDTEQRVVPMERLLRMDYRDYQRDVNKAVIKALNDLFVAPEETTEGTSKDLRRLAY